MALTLTRVQGGTTASVNPITAPEFVAVAGNLYVALFSIFSATDFVSIQDTAGSTWRPIAGVAQSSNSSNLYAYYAYATTGHPHNIVTVTMGASHVYSWIAVYQIHSSNGDFTTDPFAAVSKSAGASSTTMTTGTLTLGAGNFVILAFGTTGSGRTATPGLGYVLVNSAVTGDAATFWHDESHVDVTASEAATATITADAWGFSGVAFKEPAGGPVLLTVTGTVSSAGTALKMDSHRTAGASPLVGAPTQTTAHRSTATLTSGSTVRLQDQRRASGTLSSTARRLRTVVTTRTGAVPSAATLTRLLLQGRHRLTTPTGAVRTQSAITARGTAGPSGSGQTAGLAPRSLSGTVTGAGTVARLAAATQGGALPLLGVTGPAVGRGLRGTARPDSEVRRATEKDRTGAVRAQGLVRRVLSGPLGAGVLALASAIATAVGVVFRPEVVDLPAAPTGPVDLRATSSDDPDEWWTAEE